MRNFFVFRSFFLVMALAIGGTANVDAAIIDDFSDLNDTANPTWTHLTGNVGSTGQTFNADSSSAPATNPPATGGTYRLTAPANGPQLVPGQQFGFAGSYAGPSWTDVNVMADFVEPFQAAQFGVAARLNGANGFNALSGYGYVYEPGAGPNGFGEMVLLKITGAGVSDIGAQEVAGGPLDFINEDYTFSLSITGSNGTGGNVLRGWLRRISDGVVLADKTITNVSANPFNQGFSGVFGYNGKLTADPDVTHGFTDFTIDNFKTQVPEPATSLLVACGAGVILLSRRFRGGR